MTDIDITEAERADLLARARSRCFFLDVDDAGARLCRANMPFGLAKIHWMQTELGVEPDACYISTPDSTVTRNRDRWRSGFGYGGAIEWGGDFVPLELKPNCCGMLVVGLDELPPEGVLEEVVGRLAETSLEVDGVAAQWDMHRGNHFLNLYEVDSPAVTGGHRFVAVMHSSGSELRGPNQRGPGLYLGGPRTGSSLAELAEAMPTPFGPAYLVRGERAELYLDYVIEVERFAKARRRAYARAIFGAEAEILFNETHQGMLHPGRMLLGCYDVVASGVDWVPVTLRSDLPAYLVSPEEIYAEATLAREGLLDQARDQRCVERLLGAGLLPHGGGYAYPEAEGGEVEVEDRGPMKPRRFRVPGQVDWFESVRDLEYTYRGEKVLQRLEELGSGRIASRLELIRRLEG